MEMMCTRHGKIINGSNSLCKLGLLFPIVLKKTYVEVVS